MFKKRKKNPNCFEFSEKDILNYDEELLRQKLIKMYPIGTVIDQSTAYNGKGSNNAIISSGEIRISEYKGRKNISFGGYGIWNSENKKLAKIIKNVKKES